MSLRPTWPVMATTGTESSIASASGVTRLVAPGPEVAMHTPTRPVACAYPVAACPAPCSWRTRTWRTRVESSSGSYAGRIVPPGMPNTTSQPTSSSDRTSDCAPVIGTASKRRTGAAAGAPAGPGRPGGGAGLGPGGPGTGPGRGEAVVMGSSAHLRVSEHEKTPDRRGAERGWRVDVRAHSGVDAPGKYEDEDGGHGADGSRSDRRAVKPLGRRSRIVDSDRVTPTARMSGKPPSGHQTS